MKRRASVSNRREENSLNLKLITNAASKAVTNNSKNSLYKKEIFEFRDCNQILTFQSVNILQICKSTLENIIHTFENEGQDSNGNVVMISSVIANLICTFDFNNSKILKKRLQLLACNKLVKLSEISENDKIDFNITLAAPDMLVENFEAYQEKFYNRSYQLKLLKSCQKVIENELYLLNKKKSILNNRFNDDSCSKLEKHCATVCNFEDFFSILPELALVLEDFDNESAQEHHLVLGIQVLQKISVTTVSIVKNSIEKYVEEHILSFESEHFLIHKIYYVLLVLLRYTATLGNVLKQFYQTNKLLLYGKAFIQRVSDKAAFENMLNNIELLDARLLIPINSLVTSFCVEHSMLVNQSNVVIVNLKERYFDNLLNYFYNLNNLIGDFTATLKNLKDINLTNSVVTSLSQIQSDEAKFNNNYFKQTEREKESGSKRSGPGQGENTYTYNTSRMNSFEPNKRNIIYRTSSDLVYKEDAALNVRISKSAVAFSSSVASSNSSSRVNSLNSQSNTTSQKVLFHDGSIANRSMKTDGATKLPSSGKSLSRTRSSSLNGNKPTDQSRSRSSSTSNNNHNGIALSRASSTNSVNAATKSRSRSSSVNNTNHNFVLTRSRSSSASNQNGLRKLENGIGNLSVAQESDEEGTAKLKVRFIGVPHYPMKNEDPVPTKQGWYTKPAVLHYPMLPSSYATNIATIKQSPFNKLKQIEGFAFKHSNDLFSQ